MPAKQRKTNRIEKVNSLIQQILGGILQPYLENINAIVTISKVETSRDLKWAKVWISIVNGEDGQILNHLKNNIFEIQGELNRTMEIKIVPRISFYLDTSARHAQHLDEIFKRLKDEAEEIEKRKENE